MTSARAYRRLTSRRRPSRRRRSAFLVSGASLTAAIAAALSVASLNGVDLADAAVTKAKSFVELMSQRSPGQRTTAQLNKTKHRHFKVLAASAPAIVPPAYYTPAVALFAPPAAMLPGPVFPPPIPAIAESPPPLIPSLFTPGGGVLIPGAPGGSGGPPGGGGGGPPGGPLTVTPPPGVAPTIGGVPEPGTWMTMVLGFALTGGMIRRRRRDGAGPARR